MTGRGFRAPRQVMASGLGGRALVGVPAGFDDAGGHVEVVFAGADYLLGATCLFS